MVQFKILLCALVALISNGHSYAFQLKGTSIGDSPEVACQGSTVKDQMGDVIRRMKESIPRLIEMNTADCEPLVDSVAGHKPSSPPYMLFIDNKLILYKIEIDELTMSEFVEILEIFTKEHGKPLAKNQKPFSILTWKKTNQTLNMEYWSRSFDNFSVILILRDEAEFKKYNMTVENNSSLLKKHAQNAKRNSLVK